MTELNNCAIIKAYYRDKTFTSIPIDLSSQTNIQFIMDISENGSNHLQSLKIPLSSINFIVLSKAQLAETLLEIEIHPDTRQQPNPLNL